MDNLRWALLIIGVLVVAGVYIVSRQNAKRQGNEDAANVSSSKTPYKKSTMATSAGRRKRQVKIQQSSGYNHGADSNADYGNSGFSNPGFKNIGIDTPVYPAGIESLNVVVFVMTMTGMHFRKEQVVQSLRSLAFTQGVDNDFVYFIQNSSTEYRRVRLFSIRDIHHPGIFLSDEPESALTNGLALELELPLSIDSVAGFEKMLTMARLLATKINGVVCDDSRNRLTNQATMHLKDKIMDFQRKLALTQTLPLQQ